MKIVQIGERKSCQLCDLYFGADRDADYDGMTVNGPWAFMCASCHVQYGVGIGVGKGQRISWPGKIDIIYPISHLVLSSLDIAMLLDAIETWKQKIAENLANAVSAETVEVCEHYLTSAKSLKEKILAQSKKEYSER